MERGERTPVDREKFSEIAVIASKMAHDLRNPLGVINIAAYNLKKRIGENDETAMKRIAVIMQKTAEANGIITDILSYYRLDPPDKKETDLNSLMEETVSSMNGLFEAKKINVTRHEGDLPPVEIDRAQISKVMQNVIRNACEAIADDGGNISLISRCDEEGKNVEAVITDSGSGMTEEDVTRSGEPFFSTKKGRTGMGLAVSFRIVEENHNGMIVIKSKEGEGTEVTIKLPTGGDN
ncbi:MAG: HAMP domain-containing sensor histidine kinase [Candidatus Omnitrophota bacterium]